MNDRQVEALADELSALTPHPMPRGKVAFDIGFISGERLSMIVDVLRSRTPPTVDREAVARNEDAILRLVHKHFNEKDAKVLTRTVWKDSIDVDYLNLSAKNFISDVLSLLAPTYPAREGE